MIITKRYILILLVLIIIIVLGNILFFQKHILNNTIDNTKSSINTSETSKIQLIISSMTTEEKVGQLFICGYRKDISEKNIYLLSDYLINEINKYHLSGLILFSENMQNANQLKKLIVDINNVDTEIPMFISVDVEGGLVDRLAKSSITQSLPYISKLGNTKDTNLSYEYSKIIGRQLASLGFNLDFAPVCDLDNSDSIKYRSFGKDPILVGKMVAAYIKGLKEYKIGSTIKHFPGLGTSIGDTHTVVAHSNSTLENLEKNDFIPFKYGIDAGSNIVMISHVIYDNLSENKLPASLNSDIYSILRNKLNFNGIIITDGLEMGAITKQNITTTPSYATFIAGADMLLLPENIDKSYYEILNAVNSGKISIERLDSSVERILEYKDKLGMFSKNETTVNLNDMNDQKVIDSINNY